MTRFFDIDDANETLLEVGPLLATLADQRLELIRLRDRSMAAHSPAGGASGDANDGVDEAEARRLQLRMKGVIDQMAAAVVGSRPRAITSMSTTGGRSVPSSSREARDSRSVSDQRSPSSPAARGSWVGDWAACAA